jgi:hypothetical protein
VKIDVEGGEGPILEQILTELAMFPTEVEFLAELGVDETAKGAPTASELVAEFNRAGFRSYGIANPYDVPSYLRCRAPEAAHALRMPVTTQTDVLFSRAV